MTLVLYTASCTYSSEDTVTVEDPKRSDSDEVRLGLTGASVYLTPKKARRLAKAIKKAARRAERIAKEV